MDGVLVLVTPVAVGVAVIGAFLYARPIAVGVVRTARRLHLLPEPPESPVGMPLERIARDLRRLRPEVRHRPGRPVARHRGIVAAYDGALVDACRALGIATELADLPDGLDRETERLRVEAALTEAGVDLRPSDPPGGRPGR